MSVTTAIKHDDTNDNPEQFEARKFPQTTVPVVGQNIVGRFQRLEQGPANGYGTPIILVFEGVSGTYAPKVGEPTQRIEPGSEYGLWLIHAVLRKEFIKAEPKVGELFVVRYEGQRLKFGVTEATAKDKDRYHLYHVTMPERPVAPVTWGQLSDTDTAEF